MKGKSFRIGWSSWIARCLFVVSLVIWGNIAPTDAAQTDIEASCEGQAVSGAARRLNPDASSVILVANPGFKDPLWRRTVLLAAPLSNGGHVGLILNRPTDLTLAQLFPEHELSQRVTDRVYVGGPFFSDVLVALVRSEAPPRSGTVPMARDLALVVDESAIDSTIERLGANARYFVGMVVWRPGELDREITSRLWSICRPTTETVFRADVRQLWKELSAATHRKHVDGPLPTNSFAQMAAQQ